MKEQKALFLSIIVPCYNEGKNIELCAAAIRDEMKKLTTQIADYELIFIDDGSTDNTFKYIHDIAQETKQIKYISFSRNFGKEAAMLAGLEHCTGECAVIMDADLQHPPELLEEMLTQYAKGFDQVIAKRNRKGDSKINTALARTYYYISRKILDVEMIDGAGDFRLLSRKAVDALISLKESNRFSKGLFSWIGFNKTYIPYENRERVAGKSKWSFKKLFQYGVDGIISFNSKPLRFCIYLGGILLFFSFLYLLYLLISIYINGIDTPGYFTTILIITIFSSVQLISIGVIGEYLGMVYYEVKRRPNYLIGHTNLGEGTKDAVGGKGDDNEANIKADHNP